MEVFKVGNELVYVPKIKQYRVNFDRQNSKFTSACASAEFVDIYFNYLYAANVFDYEALKDPEIKRDFEYLLRLWENVRELTLRYRMMFSLTGADGAEWIPPTELELERDLSYDENLALAKEQEAAVLYKTMQSDLVQQVMRRLSSAQPTAAS